MDDDFVRVPKTAAGVIGRCLHEGRWYEEKMLNYIASLELDGIYLDVGANIGNHAMFFAKHTRASHVFSVEPTHSTLAILYEFLILNDAVSRISVLPFAAGSDRETFALDAATVRFSKQTHVPSIRLDDVIPDGVTLLKMDIEGAEPVALKGMTRILTVDRPRMFIEANDESAKAAIERIILPLDYRPTGQVFNASPTYEYMPA